jgi:hypothetical protein
MGATPQLFGLFWHAPAPVPAHPLIVDVALQHANTIDTRPPIPAVLLFPALLTPAMHVRGQNSGMIQLLVAGKKAPPLRPAHVNLHLKLGKGLDPKKRPSLMPLFANPKDKILVEEVAIDGNGIIRAHAQFRAILAPRVRDHLPQELDTFYAVQVHESCLEGPALEGPHGDPHPELQDQLIAAMLTRLNGSQLQGQGGRGTHEFAVTSGGVDLERPDQRHPIVAYHPLFVYPEKGLDRASVGHVSDIHLNARQELLRRSPARVIDAEDQTDSPRIGTVMNTCASSLSSILAAMAAKGDKLDVLLVGGDLIDHIQNAYPFTADRDAATLEAPSARAVWDLVDLEDAKGYAAHYQAFVDFIVFFTLIRHFVASNHKPAFAITGNHDCYEEAYGTSPRVLARTQRANEGIPADNNLTFYEAILVFGETWHIVRRQLTPPNFTPALFEWFYTVLTPFTDFSVELPAQRLVGLAWGEDEEIMSGPGSWGQGVGHLPRAEEAVTDGQLALFRDGFGPGKKTVLMTHFTFVSYNDQIPFRPGPVPGGVDVSGPGIFRKGDPFGSHDLGTFERNRAALYESVAQRDSMVCVVTGHSHRKGLYFLGSHEGGRYATQMYGLLDPAQIAGLPQSAGRTPIVVSDSAGPLPRLNIQNEFGEWGSDRPAGTLVEVGADGHVLQVEAITSQTPQARPRLAVAVDYTHVIRKRVFRDMKVMPFDRARATKVRHEISIRFHETFPVALATGFDVVLYGRASANAAWTRIALVQIGVESPGGDRSTTTIRLAVPASEAARFFEWLTLGSRAGRFMSFGFASAGDSSTSTTAPAAGIWR